MNKSRREWRQRFEEEDYLGKRGKTHLITYGGLQHQVFENVVQPQVHVIFRQLNGFDSSSFKCNFQKWTLSWGCTIFSGNVLPFILLPQSSFDFINLYPLTQLNSKYKAYQEFYICGNCNFSCKEGHLAWLDRYCILSQEKIRSLQ